MSDKKIVLFGGSGLLGQAFAEALTRSSGYTVMTPSSTEVDVTNLTQVKAYLEKTEPDIVITSVAIKNSDICHTEPYRAWLINTHAAGNVAQAAALRPGTQIVFVSSSEVFSDPHVNRFMEDTTPTPVSVYGWSKYAAEKMVEEIAEAAQLPYYILRVSWLYGSHKKTFIDVLAETLKSGERLTAATDQFDVPIHTQDAAQALLNLLQKESPSGIYHLADPESTTRFTRFDIAQTIATMIGADPGLIDASTREEIFTSPRPGNSLLGNSHNDILKMPDWQTSLKTYLCDE